MKFLQISGFLLKSWGVCDQKKTIQNGGGPTKKLYRGPCILSTALAGYPDFFSEWCYANEIWAGTQLSKFPKNRSWNFHKLFNFVWVFTKINRNGVAKLCDLKTINCIRKLLKKTLPAHHQQKLTKKCFFIFIQIFNFFLPCRLSHLTYHLFLAFFLEVNFDAIFISGHGEFLEGVYEIELDTKTEYEGL